jgi:hypothetical protein
VQQACFCGALAAAMYAVGLEARAVAEMVTIGVFLAAGYWYVMGCLMTAEWPHLSRRVQRSLPQSQLGRTFLSLFNPGPGAGYLFAVANLTMLAVAGLIALVISLNWTTSTPFSHLAIASVILCWGYVVAFLGLGRLVINLLRRWVYVPMAGGFLVHVILLLSGIGIPTIIQMTSRTLRYGGYSMVQVTNPFWTLMEVVERGGRNVEVEVLVLLIPAAAAAMLLLNIRSVAAELMHHRIAPPIRVAEDEAALRPAPVQKPANPWETADEAPTT